jgi:hypothetical protein
MLPDPVLNLVLYWCEDNCRRRRPSAKVTMWQCAVMAGLLGSAALIMLAKGAPLRVAGGFFAAAVFLAGLAGFFVRQQRVNADGREHPLHLLLRDRASEVVWVSHVHMIGRAIDRDHVAFHLESGEHADALMISPNPSARLLDALEAAMPWATFGQGREPGELFERDPRLLRRAVN